MLLKKAKESWKGNFDKLLASSERKEFTNTRRYYESQYNIAIDEYLRTGKTNGFDHLFKVAELSDLYRQIYVNIGLKFAKWYSKNFDKVISKQTDVSGYDDIWAERFARSANIIAAERVVLVQGTAKATLINIFKRLSLDTEFMAMSDAEAGRLLRQKFSQYSKSQAERLVRTEATLVANYATLESATDMFGQENLQKEWMTSVDGRERPAHRAVDGDIVDFKERFNVGGELLFQPGDPFGSAKNVVNCRCSVAPFPKENAQATGTIEGFGVRTPDGSTQSALRTPKPVREAVEEVDDLALKKESLRPDEWNKWIKEGEISNDDYILLMNKKIKYVNDSRKHPYCRYDGSYISMQTAKYRKKGKEILERAIAHEMGHAVHINRGWVTMDKPIKDFDPDILRVFKKWERKFGVVSPEETLGLSFEENMALARVRSQLADKLRKYRKGYWDADLRAEKYRKMDGNLYRDMVTATADIVEALTKGSAGWGHGSSYYAKVGGKLRYMEFVAHAFENYYVGNPIFKEIFPELYKDLIDLMKILIKK
jgi:hypothetical protein